MVKFVPHPNVEELLPPFLAHIPIAFSSPHAPPSLLSLLAPILRSRVRLLSGGEGDKSVTESWLSLLTWSRDGALLTRKLGSQDFQPHPSGEIEIGDYHFKGIQRTDSETLKACVELKERDIDIIYVWVAADDEGSGWKIMDVKVIGGRDEDDYEKRESENTIIDGHLGQGEGWFSTVSAADIAFFQNEEKEAAAISKLSVPEALNLKEDEEEDDAAYWAQYDQTPARTPAVNHLDRKQPSEDEYFARYSTVSPALEPPETSISPSITTQYNNTYTSPLQTLPPLHPLAFSPFAIPLSPPTSSPRSKPVSMTSTPPQTAVSTSSQSESTTIKTASPRPTSPASSTRASIEKLEREASIAVQAEVAIKQHISAQLKSLYRLAKCSGIDQEEFKRVVSTEMEILQMVDEDDANVESQEGW